MRKSTNGLPDQVSKIPWRECGLSSKRLRDMTVPLMALMFQGPARCGGSTE